MSYGRFTLVWLRGNGILQMLMGVCGAKWVWFGWVMCGVPRPVERLGPRTFGDSLPPAQDGNLV